MYDKIVILLADICFMDKADLKKRLGQRIVELRKGKGWNQSDLARACNKDRQAIEKIENGKVNPTIYTVLEICKVLEISLSDFFKF